MCSTTTFHKDGSFATPATPRSEPSKCRNSPHFEANHPILKRTIANSETNYPKSPVSRDAKSAERSVDLSPHPRLLLRHRHHLSPRPSRQRWQNLVRRITQKPHRTIGEGEMSAAGVDAPELKNATGVVEFARFEFERPALAAVPVSSGKSNSDAEMTVRLTIFIRAPTGIPPTQTQIQILPTRRPYAK